MAWKVVSHGHIETVISDVANQFRKQEDLTDAEYRIKKAIAELVREVLAASDGSVRVECNGNAFTMGHVASHRVQVLIEPIYESDSQ